MSVTRGPISQFIEKNYLHFNAAALVDAAKGYETHLAAGGKMMVTLAGAMSTAELGISLAEMIRQDKIAIISCTGANLEEDIMKPGSAFTLQTGTQLPRFKPAGRMGFAGEPLQPGNRHLYPRRRSFQALAEAYLQNLERRRYK